MKKMFLIMLALVLALGLMTTDAFALGDGNIDQGGGHMGDGTGESHWNPGRDGVRITVVDTLTGERAAGTKTFDWLRFQVEEKEKNYIHFGGPEGANSKLDYAKRPKLVWNLGEHQYEYNKTMRAEITIISLNPNEYTLAQIKSFFTDEGILKDIATDAGISYAQLISGRYKVLIEPVALFKFDGVYYLMTPTEAAIFDKNLSSRLPSKKYEGHSLFFTAMKSFSHQDFPLALMLSEDEIGFNAPARTELADEEYIDNDEIIDTGYGMGVVRFKLKITETHNEGGNVTPAGTTEHKKGSDQTYRITPSDGYVIQDVVVDGESVGQPTEYTFEDIQKDHTIDVTFAKEENIITIKYIGLPGGAFSTQTRVKAGEDYTAKITVNNPAYKITDVNVDGDSKGVISEYEFKEVYEKHLIVVTCEKTGEETFNLKISVSGSGTVNPGAGTHAYEKGEKVTVKITPAEGWELDKITDNGSKVTNTKNYKVTMDKNHDIVVTFKQKAPDTHDIKITVNGSGTVNPGEGVHSYEDGKKVTVKITPAEGWELDKITDNGSKVTNTTSYKITADKDHDIVVTFKEKEPDTHDLNIMVNGSGTVTPGAGSYMVEDGATVPIEITPSSGWEIGSITDNGKSVTPTDKYNVTVNEDHNIVVTFTKEETQKYTVTIKAQGSGTGTVLVQDVAVASGDTRTIEVSKGSTLHFTTSTAADSYMQSAKVTLNGRTTTVTTEDFTITNLSSNATVVVTFGVDSTPNHQGISSENMGGDGSLKAGYGFYLDQKFTYPTYDHSTWSKTDGAEYKVTVKSVDATYASISFQTASGPVNIPVTLEKGSDGLYHFPKAGVNNLRKLYVPVETLDGTYTLYVTVEATLEVQTWNRQLTANYGLIPQYKDVIDPETGEPVIDEETGEVKQEFSHYKWGWLGTYSWVWETLTSEREYSDTVTYAIVIKGVMYEDDFTGDR